VSDVYAIWCDTHEVYGPTVRRSASGLTLHPLFPTQGGGGRAAWAQFLVDHQFCHKELHHESSYLTSSEYAKQKQDAE
jgi:hypothetical protein